MKRLMLVRHAKSSWKNACLADIDRPLSGRGKRDAVRVGEYLATQGIRPDIILSSPARRARKTAKLLAKQIPDCLGRLLFDPALYAAGSDLFLERVRTLDESWEQVMLVGHNPGLTEFANRLAAVNIDNIPTCGVLVAELGIESWRQAEDGSGMAIMYLVPSDLSPKSPKGKSSP
jgi:phosphohistidine phosphatase